MTEVHRGSWGVRRGVRALGLCVIAASALAFVFAGASTADVTGSYVAAVDVGSVEAGSPITVTIRNCSTSTEGCSQDSASLGSVDVMISGAGLTSASIGTVDGSKTWQATLTGDTVELRAASANELAPGESLTVQITPTTTGTFTVATTGREATDFSGPDFAHPPDPGLTVTPGPLDHFTWTTEPNESQTAGAQINAAVTAYDGLGNIKTDYAGSGFSGLSESVSGCDESGTVPNGEAHPCHPVYASFSAGVASGFTGYLAESSPGLTITDGSISASSSGFTVSPAAASHFNLPTPAAQTAGTPFDQSITAFDPYGNTDTNYSGGALVFSGPNNSPNNTAPIYPSSVSFDNGVGTASIQLFDAASTSLTASKDGVSGTTEGFDVGPASATHLQVPTPASQTAGNDFNETISALDPYDNKDTNYSGAKPAVFSGPNPSPSPSNTGPIYPASLTFASGDATASIRLFRAETTTLGVSAGGLSGTTPASFIVAPAPASHFILPTPPAQTAGTPFDQSITALDPYDNVDTNYSGGAITFTGPHNSPSGAAPSYPATTSFSGGQGTASITLYKAESTTLTATRGGVSGATASFVVGPASATHLQVPTPTSRTAGIAFNETISALDPYDNKDTNYSGVKPAAFSGPNPSPNGTGPIYPASLTFASGDATASIRLFRAETTTLGVSAGGLSGTTPASFIVAPAPASHFILPTPAQQTAGASFNEPMTALDPYDNVDTNYAGGAITFTGPHNSPNGTAPSYPATVSFSAGQGTASITLYKAESTTLTATRLGVSGTTPSAFTVVPAAPAALSFTQQPTETQFNSVINATTSPAGVRVEAKDSFGNLAYNTSVKIAIGSNPGGGTLGGTTTQATNASGVAVFGNLTIDKVGIGYTLVATAPPISPTATPKTSIAFIIAQTVTACSGTCNGTATVPNNTILNVSANGTATANTLGIALIGAVAQPAGVCPGFAPAVGSPGSFVNVNFVSGGSNRPSLTITWTLAKAVVNRQPDNGAAHYNMCLGSVNLEHPDGSGINGYPIKAPALCPGKGLISTACPVADTTFGVTFFWGILPDCPKKTPLTGPCVVSRSKNPAGDLIFVYTVPYPWDPNGHLG